MKNSEIEHKTNFDLKLYNTLRISSIADDVYFPVTDEEFILLLANLDNPLVMGMGSNILLSSAGTHTPCIITKGLNKIKVNAPFFEVQTGVSAPKLANIALELKLTGFEFLSSLPATIGGAVCMNAGAYNQTIKDCFIEAKIYDSVEDKTICLTKENMGFSYRNSMLKNQERYFLISAKFELKESDDYDSIQNLMNKNIEKRKEFQPNLKEPNLGCVFKNPDNMIAGKMIDECNLKSLSFGGAIVSYKHANFIVNFNNATSLDYLNLMLEIQTKVKEKFNVKLQPEILYVGEDEKEQKLWQELIK